MLRQAVNVLISILMTVAFLAVVIVARCNVMRYEEIGYRAPILFMLLALAFVFVVSLIDKKRIAAGLICVFVSVRLFTISWDSVSRMSPSMEADIRQYLRVLVG